MKPVWNVDTVSTLKWQRVELREAGTVTIVIVSRHFFCDSLHGFNYQFVQINSGVLKSIDMGPLPCESKLGYENPVNYPTGVEYLLERERKRIRHSKSMTKLICYFVFLAWIWNKSCETGYELTFSFYPYMYKCISRRPCLQKSSINTMINNMFSISKVPTENKMPVWGHQNWDHSLNF